MAMPVGMALGCVPTSLIAPSPSIQAKMSSPVEPGVARLGSLALGRNLLILSFGCSLLTDVSILAFGLHNGQVEEVEKLIVYLEVMLELFWRRISSDKLGQSVVENCLWK
jgi:hypothetical protein